MSDPNESGFVGLMAKRKFKLGEPFEDAPKSLPPWDGTGVPLPVDENGWPVLPDGVGPEPTTLSLAGVPAPPSLVEGSTIVLTATASAPIPGNVVKFEWSTDGGVTWETSGTPEGPPDTLTWTMDAAPGGAAGTTAAYRASDPNDPEVVSNVLAYDIVAPVEGGEPDMSKSGVVADFQGGDPVPVDEGYEPYDHTVVEVQDYLNVHPDQTEYVLGRERAGKNRITLTGGTT